MMDCRVEHRINLVTVPHEILEKIWCDCCLNCRDICNLAAVCTVFRQISSSNEVWRIKFKQRWPHLVPLYKKYNKAYHPEWRKEYHSRKVCGQRMQEQVSQMSSRWYHKDEVCNRAYDSLCDFISNCTSEKQTEADAHVLDELREIICDGDSNKNLTHKYYAVKAHRFFRHVQLKRDILHHVNGQEQFVSLEKGALLISQWCQPLLEETFEDIQQQLDNIAVQVRKTVRSRRPDHPLCKPCPEQGSLISPERAREVLEAMNDVLYKQLGFRGNDDDYYHPFNSYIEKILELKKGIPISLSVVYAAISCRLGVTCQPVGFPQHFLLKWLENPDATEEEQYTYIDTFNEGRFLAQGQCCSTFRIPSQLREGILFEAISKNEVLKRMARNLVNIGRQNTGLGNGLVALRNSLELLHLLCPDEIDCVLMLTRIYEHLDVNKKEIENFIEVARSKGNSMLADNLMLLVGPHKDEEDQPVPRIRPKKRTDKDVLYSVGLIMKHRRYNYTCVLYGWDPLCQASNEWIMQMGVHNLSNRQFQPFYNVLVEDGSNRYAAQENLELAENPKVIDHSEVGRYFKEFCGTFYLPNAEKAQEYPDDLQRTEKYVQDTYNC